MTTWARRDDNEAVALTLVVTPLPPLPHPDGAYVGRQRDDEARLVLAPIFLTLTLTLTLAVSPLARHDIAAAASAPTSPIPG